MKVKFNKRLSPSSLAALITLPIALVFSASVAGFEPIPEKPPVGKAAPDFTLPDWHGKNVSLNHFREKFVVLEWFSDECPFVKKHYKSDNMQGLQKEFVKKGVVWLTICSSAPNKPGFHTNKEHKKVLKKWNAEMSDFLIDAEGKVGREYGSKNTPTMYVIGKDGTLIYEGAIDDKRDADVASVKGANNYVRAALTQAMAGEPVKEAVTKAYG